MFKTFLITTTLIAGLIVRLYHFDRPVADWHSFRQADTASVTRNLFDGSGTVIKPTYHDLSNIASGQDNPQGYRMVEFPLYNYLSAIPPHIFTTLSIESSSRLISIVFSLLSALLIFLLTYQNVRNFTASYFTMFAFLFNPFVIFYSSTILPEPTAVLFLLLSLLLFPRHFFLSATSLAVAILVKPYTAILVLPWLAYQSFLFLQKSKLSLKTISLFIVFTLVSLSPFIIWRIWISQFPQGIPANAWLFNEGNLRLRPAWFRWLFIERIGKLILGVYEVAVLILGFAYKKNRSQALTLSSFTAMLLYFLIIARGNVQHDYYQFLVTPFLAIIVGLGYYYLVNFVFSNRLYSIIAALSVFSMSTFYGWYQIRDYYQINNPDIVAAGRMVDQLTPKDSIIIAPYNGDTAFLYQTHRQGYPIEIYDWPKVFSLSGSRPIYYVSTSYNDYTSQLASESSTIYKDRRFIILQIR
jgi:hypothetical protein